MDEPASPSDMKPRDHTKPAQAKGAFAAFRTVPGIFLLAMFFAVSPASADGVFASEKASFRATTLTRGLEHPWSVACLPDGGFLITERPGRLRRIDATGALDPEPITGVPEVAAFGQAGLLDVLLHPEFESNRTLFLSYVAGVGGQVNTEVARARLEGNALRDVEVIFTAMPKTGGGYHVGSRLALDGQGRLLVSLGDRGLRHPAQDLFQHTGSMVRILPDGKVPPDNPFIGKPGARPEILTYGHRNIQGLAVNQRSGEIWAHEHGPQGGDELNRIVSGANYGWPIVTYGKEYGSGASIGEGVSKPGMVSPVHQWSPSIAPSGMAFYDGSRFPGWNGSLFVGSLKFRYLARLELNAGRVVHEEQLLGGKFGRIRDVRTDRRGYVYFLTDAVDGRLVRLEPVP